MFNEVVPESDDEPDAEAEKARRRQKMAQKKVENDPDSYVKRPGRLKPFDKTTRRFDWHEETDEDNE